MKEKAVGIMKNTAKAAAFIAFIIIYQCPIRLIFGIECPGCGLTSAVLYAARFDFIGAFHAHELFLIPVVTVIYLLFRKKFRLPAKAEITVGVLFIAAFLARYIIKLCLIY